MTYHWTEDGPVSTVEFIAIIKENLAYLKPEDPAAHEQRELLEELRREYFGGLPGNAQRRIERFRTDLRKYPRYNELHRCRLSGYLEGLQDAGVITQQERDFIYTDIVR